MRSITQLFNIIQFKSVCTLVTHIAGQKLLTDLYVRIIKEGVLDVKRQAKLVFFDVQQSIARPRLLSRVMKAKAGLM